MLIRVEKAGMIKGLLPELRSGEWYHCSMQMIPSFFSNPDELYLRNLKSSLIWFENLSGVKN
jgi:hypothetical protein